MKRILSFILCVIMVAVMLPVSLFVISAEGETSEQLIYENHFDSADDVVEDENTTIGASKWVFYDSNGGGILQLKGYSKSPYNEGLGTWERKFDISQTEGKVKITVKIIATANKSGQAVTINGTTVMKTSASGKTPRLEIVGNTNWVISDYGQSFDGGVLATFVYDTTTGVVTVTCDDNGTIKSGSVNVGVPTEEGVLTLKFGNCSNATWYVDDLCVYTYHTLPEAPAAECNAWVSGHQKTDVNGGRYNVRFIAGVSELVAGQSAIGFEISTTADGGKSWLKETSTVYESIAANYGADALLATEVPGASYLTALAITGIPAELGEVTFVVTPYAIIAGEKVYGEAVTITVTPTYPAE